MSTEKQIKYLIGFFIVGLVVSGLTAFPIAWQLTIARDWFRENGWNNNLSRWLEFVYAGVTNTYREYPFIAYGTDWLAFAHLVIAVVFIGPLRDPVRNIWVIQFGLIACAAVIPLAFIAGEAREIPIFWRLIDCAFGIVGGALLWICYRKIQKLEKLQTTKP
jgi:hypothetical protein